MKDAWNCISKNLKFLNDPNILFWIFVTIIEKVSQYNNFWLYFLQLYAYMQLISTVYKLRKLLVMFNVLRLYASFGFHSDRTIVFRSFDFPRSASFTAFRKWITYLIYFSLPKCETDLQFSINLRLIKVLHRESKSELSKNWTIVPGELTSSNGSSSTNMCPIIIIYFEGGTRCKQHCNQFSKHHNESKYGLLSW